MKKLLVCVLLFTVVMGTSVSAWEPEDLLKFPVGQENGDWILNLGFGFGSLLDGTISSNYYRLPSVRLSFDRNSAIDDLPFFFGGLVRYSGYGRTKHGNLQAYHRHILGVGFRVGYHFNWDVEGLDTYAVTTAGSRFRFYAPDAPGHSEDAHDYIAIDLGVGVRYFISESFGFWAEAGLGFFTAHNIELGFAFKF